MALNVATLKTRSLTAVVFVVIMLAGLLWNFWSFLILFTIVHFGCWLEYLKLVEKIYSITIDNFIKKFFAVCGVVLMIVMGQNRFGGDIIKPILDYNISIKWMLWIFLIFLLVIFIIQNKQILARAKWVMFAGFIYVSLPLTLLLSLINDLCLII